MSPAEIDRRAFLQAMFGGGGLILHAHARLPTRVVGELADDFAFGPFLQIARSGDVTIWVTRSEMGQGISTALAMIVAEELEAPWERVRIRQADLDRKYGPQGTTGSQSIRTMWRPLRQAGAAA